MHIFLKKSVYSSETLVSIHHTTAVQVLPELSYVDVPILYYRAYIYCVIILLGEI
jgi:hypothetical protein